MRASPVTALLGAAVLSGCVSWIPGPPPAVAPAAAEPDPAEMRLVEAVERAERALASLARALPVADPSSVLPRVEGVPEGLRRPVTLDWTGPVEALAADLARRAGYGFAQAGRAPARPLIVAVAAKDEPLVAVLRDLGLRAGAAATLTVDAGRRTVLLDWTAPESAPAGEEDG
ncbi:MAG: DotD/TraH family lipoprotein [Rhodospirillaceae bacterium]|nr:DotD/TraH family lipoprotein [Rhodospirillaceae bacterium]